MRGRGAYEGHNATVRAMGHDGEMIHDDYSAPALCPRHVIEMEWPELGRYMDERMPDLFSGVQRQMKKDMSDMKKLYKPAKQ